MHSFNIIKLDETKSTNMHITDLLSDNSIPLNTVLTSKFQSYGKGQGSNTWLSEYGKNLLCSLLISPDFINPRKQFLLSKISSLSINDTLHELNLKGFIKWPNDILVNSKKIAGILIENTLMDQSIIKSVIGIGLNVNQISFPELNNVTSVALETGKENDIDNLLDILLEKFEFWYNKVEAGDAEDLDVEYLENLYGLNRELMFKMGNRTFHATITGVGESGKLFLRRDDGKIIKAAFREIEFL